MSTLEGDPDPYGLLGIRAGAGDDEVRAAWHREVKRWHPDHNNDPRATTHTIALTKAFHLLSDPARRRAYDLTHGHRVRPWRPTVIRSPARRFDSEGLLARVFSRGLLIAVTCYAVLWGGLYGAMHMASGTNAGNASPGQAAMGGIVPVDPHQLLLEAPDVGTAWQAVDSTSGSASRGYIIAWAATTLGDGTATVQETVYVTGTVGGAASWYRFTESDLQSSTGLAMSRPLGIGEVSTSVLDPADGSENILWTHRNVVALVHVHLNDHAPDIQQRSIGFARAADVKIAGFVS